MGTSANTELVKQKVAARARAKTDKLYLATEVLGYDFQADVHSELFEQYVPLDPKKPWEEQSEIKDRMVLWPRGHYKTTSIVVECIQIILNFPDIRILLMQGTLKTTKGLLHEIKSHFTGEAQHSTLRELFPEFCADRLGTELSFTVPCRKRKQSPQATVTIASPKATKTGQHYDVGFFDDLINDQNYRSPKLIQKAIDDFNMCQPLVLEGYRYVTGTRYAFGDLYEVIMRGDTDKHRWKISVKTCWASDGITPRFPQRLTPSGRIIGFTRERLISIREDDPAMFAGQYLNQPVSTANQLFTDAKMLGAVITEADSPALSQAILFVDLASSESVNADDSVIVAGKVDGIGRMYVVDAVGDQWSPNQLAHEVIRMSLKHRPLRVMFEGTASCVYFVNFLRVICRDKGVQLPIETIKVSSQPDAKHIRVSALEGHIRNRRLMFFAGLPCWDKMLEQFKQFPAGRHRHDDYPDTVALMAQHFGGHITPLKPFSEERFPILKMMEMQEARDITSSILTQAQEDLENTLGDDFAC